jgi:DNA-binding CsgD family transcriptional regulator/GAF domain-containing protein
MTEPDLLSTLSTRANALAFEAAERLQRPPPAPAVLTDPLRLREWLSDTAQAATSALAERATLDGEAEQLLRLVLEARDLALLCDGVVVAARAARESSVAAALHDLRTVGTAAGLLDRACDVLIGRCGFQRALLSRTDGERWLPWKARFVGDGEFAQRFVQELQQRRIDLQDAPLERGVVEGRRPAIVLDARGDERTNKPTVELGRTRSYVVAPIIPGGRVVGFFHADHHPCEQPVTEDDRDALWAFAEGFGRLYERAVLKERLAAQRRHIESAFASARETVETLARMELRLVDVDGDPLHVPAVPPPARNEAMQALMTEREREVLELLVRGLGNRDIAERLVVQVGTVKTHVKAILRKLGATSRSEVIAMYVRSAPKQPL